LVRAVATALANATSEAATTMRVTSRVMRMPSYLLEYNTSDPGRLGT